MWVSEFIDPPPAPFQTTAPCPLSVRLNHLSSSSYCLLLPAWWLLTGKLLLVSAALVSSKPTTNTVSFCCCFESIRCMGVNCTIDHWIPRPIDKILWKNLSQTKSRVWWWWRWWWWWWVNLPIECRRLFCKMCSTKHQTDKETARHLYLHGTYTYTYIDKQTGMMT